MIAKSLLALSFCAFSLAGWQARGALPRWMQDAIGGSAIESALYRMIELPFVKTLYPRPPKEAQAQLSELMGKSKDDPALYSLRALEEEQSLDFPAAQSDWKTYASRAQDKIGASLELADYYHRRLQSKDEIRTLMEVGSSPAQPSEAYVSPAEQRSWKAFESILPVAVDQGLDEKVVWDCYAAWIARYPKQPSLYAREFQWLLDQSMSADRFDRAGELIAQYRRAFPQDAVFLVKSTALLEYRRGSIDKALATYDAGFTPLWPAELVESYYSLLTQTHQLRHFIADARARLAQNPDDLNAMSRIFYYAQQQGNLEVAQQTIDAYRLGKDARKATWTAQELYTLAQLTLGIHTYPEAARFDFALYHAQGSLASGASAQAAGLSGIISILLTSPEQPVELGAGNLSMYREIATLDHGPGYWNGILSLWLNSTSPEQAYHQEEQRAQPYFHRAKAAELLTILDRKYPSATDRARLHLELIGALADYGEDASVLKAGEDFLAGFTSSSDESTRVQVAMHMADSYARKQDPKAEFALYDRMLTELGAKTAGMPLTAASASMLSVSTPVQATDDQTTSVQSGIVAEGTLDSSSKKVEQSRAFEIHAGQPAGISVAGSREYREMLERYIGRLTATGQLPQALAVLRKELERNPNDPLLYERLASFLEQNNLSAQQEEVYSQAIQKFQDKTWYDKLARLYLREKKREAFATLTQQVTDIFSGTDLEEYFQKVTKGGPQLYLQLNLYAERRFPHDQVFLTNLLQAYQAKPTRDLAAWEKLLREHWSDSAQLETEFFDYLSRSGKLDAELAKLQEIVPATPQRKENPAATRELAEGEIWRSHFEESAPLMNSLVGAYPGDEELGAEASSLFRSLAYFDSQQTERAIAIEKNLLASRPAVMDRLARIGDIYADSGSDSSTGHENIAAAAAYWRRMPLVHPGNADGYLQAATVFWDYFQFDDALGEISKARAVFRKPALFGYEAGAIDEGKRDLDSAIREYVATATEVADGSGSPAIARLMQLARRQSTAKLVDQESAKAVGASYSTAALSLRERVLEVQKRNPEIQSLLETALARTTSFEQAQAIGTRAQARSLTKIYEASLERQIALVSDPVQKIEISYELARSFEGRKDTDDATRVIDRVYRDNPKLMGVVRATTDYYWRNKQCENAIHTLIAAANVAKPAQPELYRQLEVEAADKANDSGSYAQARGLMAPLIDPSSAGTDPYNGQYLAVVAESYARAGDDVELKKFYLSELASILTQSSMSVEDRKQKTALLRRGLIPALTRLKDHAAAVDQYIAILSAYPEDPSTAQEVALYALRYRQQQRLLDFMIGTMKSSPKDSRFAILLAQIQTALVNYPAAIDAYAHALTIRTDRADVYAAKADLEERLQRLDEASKDYERLYVLSYRNPDWMVRAAEVQARQGRKADAVKSLQRAWIEGHLPSATDNFRVATQLEKWNMLEESLHFAELGAKAEGDALLAGSDPGHQNGDDAEGATIYVRLLTRLRQPDRALAVLDLARSAADISPNAPSIVMEQIQKQGIASVTDSEWRKQRAMQRQKTADQRFRSSVLEMGKTASSYLGPEEKQQFAALVDARAKQAQQPLWIEVASAAGIKDEEAKLLRQQLLEGVVQGESKSDPHLSQYVELEQSRMAYSELAQTMEAYEPKANVQNRKAARVAEADADRAAGDEVAELRVLQSMRLGGDINDPRRDRHLQLLLKHDVPAFEAYGAANKDEATAMVAPNFSIAHSDVKVTRASLSNHSGTFTGPWMGAYSALAGLYFHDQSPTTESAFHSVLADKRTIGERLDHGSQSGQGPQALTGEVWFYYGMRYGVYRTLAPEKDWAQRDPEDFLPAALEQNRSAVNYIALARAYTDADKPASALTEYRHALELAPDSAAVHDAMAVLDWQANGKDAAIAHWRAALAALNRIQDKGPAPETFWSGFALVADHLSQRKLVPQLHDDINAVLRSYIARNGNYRSNELLKDIFKASGSDAEGVDWILALSTSAADPASVLEDIENMVWLPVESLEPILLRKLELARIAAARAGSEESYLADRPAQLERSLALYYVAQKQNSKAEALIEKFTDEERKDASIVEAKILLASRNKTLDALLARYRENADTPKPFPESSVLRGAAGRLDSVGDRESALAVRELIFERGLNRQDLTQLDYLALANSRLENGSVDGAVDVLRRMTLLPGDIYPRYSLAAELLEKDHAAEAIEFLSVLARSVPWNASYRLRLAKAQLHTGSLEGAKAEAIASLVDIAESKTTTYDLRVQAAAALRGQSYDPSRLGSGELRLLSAGNITPQQAEQPYFFAARIAAADSAQSKPQQATLLLQAVGINPSGLASPSSFTGDRLRLGIIRVEAALGHNSIALDAIEHMLRAPSTYLAQDMTTDNSVEIAANADSPDADDVAPQPDAGTDNSEDEAILAVMNDRVGMLTQLEQLAPLPANESQTDAETVELASLFAKIYEESDDPANALNYFKLAVYLAKEAPVHIQLQQRVEQLKAALALEDQNAQRRPKIQRALDQSNLVRPRLALADLTHIELTHADPAHTEAQ